MGGEVEGLEDELAGVVSARPASIDLLDEDSPAPFPRPLSNTNDGSSEDEVQEVSGAFGDPEDVLRRVRSRRRGTDNIPKRRGRVTGAGKPHSTGRWRPKGLSTSTVVLASVKKKGRKQRLVKGARKEELIGVDRHVAVRGNTPPKQHDREKKRRAPRRRKSLYVDDEAGVEGGVGNESEERSESELSGSFIDRDSEQSHIDSEENSDADS